MRWIKGWIEGDVDGENAKNIYVPFNQLQFTLNPRGRPPRGGIE
jgi:hypothetical protein